MSMNASLWAYPLFKNKYRVLIYSGTTDGAVPTRGTKTWIKGLGYNETQEWRPYFYNNQLAGHLESYEGGLTFATIHGTGHMAP